MIRPSPAKLLMTRARRRVAGRGSEPRRRAPRRLKATVGLLAVSALALVAAQIVLAAPPSASFTISDSTPNVGQNITFTSTSTDPDGDITTYEWDFNFDGSFNASATGTSASTSYSTGGAKTVALRVTDAAGDPAAGGDGTVDVDTSVQSFTVTVPNQNPTASFTWAAQPPHNGNRPIPGQQIGFDGTASDPDNDTLSYEWTFGDGTSSADLDTTHAYGTAGSKTVRLTVRDNRGGSFTTPPQTVIVNALPVANGAVLNNAREPGQKYNTPLVGQEFVLTPEALPALPGQQALPGSRDAEDATNLTYRWDFDNNGTFEVPGGSGGGCNGCTVHAALPAPGQRTVGLQVTDSRGAVTTKPVNFRVNSVPVAGFTWEPPTPAVAKPVQFSSTSFDPDGNAVDPLTYSWDLGDGRTAVGQNVNHSYSTPGLKTVKLSVTDTGGITRDVTRSVLVQLSVPNAAFNVSSGTPLPGQPVTFTSNSTPSEGKQITNVEWDFDYDRAGGNFTPDATGAAASHAFPSAGSKSVAIRVTEGPNGGFDIEPGTVVVNAPPQAGFRVSPDNPFIGEAATISSLAVDPDGPIAAQQWDLDGDGAFDDASGPVVFATYASPGPKTIRLRVTDSKGATAIATGAMNVRTRPLALLGGVTINFNGTLRGKITRFKTLRVRAPVGTTIVVTCKGKGCPKKKKLRTATTQGNGRFIRIKKLERRYRPGVRIVITVTKPGFLGRHTTLTTRRGAGPKRVDLCMAPDAKNPTACPAS
jgi:large repetitive protein